MSPGTADRFSTPGAIADACARLAGRRPLLVVTDFDGTLAPIVEDPAAATVLPGGRHALERLQAAAAVQVAVLSGRDAADVARRVDVAGARYLGQHGTEAAELEAAGGEPRAWSDPAMAAAREGIERIAVRAADALGHPGWLRLERKRGSVALHYRTAPDPAGARAALLAAIEEAGAGPEGRLEGRMVVELRPPGAGGKGEATRRLLDELRPRAVLVAGDDRTDLEAFRAAAAWGRETGQAVLVVGVTGSPERPDGIEELAHLRLPDPAAVAALLAILADRVGTP